jgi:capsular polysaccharide biosynthesis protein
MNPLKTIGHKVAIAVGARARPPEGFVRYAAERTGTGEGSRIHVERIFPASEEEVPLPIVIGGEPAHNFHEKHHCPFPEVYVAKMHDARLFGSAIIDADNRLIGDLSVESGVWPEVVERHSLFYRRSLPRYERLEGEYLGFSTPYADNYYHWILEFIPRLEVIRRERPDIWDRAHGVILDPIRYPFQRETLDWLQLNKPVVENDRNMQVATLFVPSRAGMMGDPPRWACEFAYDALIGLGGLRAGEFGDARQRIYISRAKAEKRRVVNEEEVLSILTPRGFVKVQLEDLSVREQIRLFSQAQAVVAPHGAGLVNTLFCNPGTPLVELFPSGKSTHCFWMLAHHRGLKYRFVSGTAGNSETSATAQTEPIIVDVNRLKTALEDFELL